MAYMDDIKFLWNLVWDPEKHTKRSMDFGTAVRLYYKLAVIPFIVYVIFGSLAIAAGLGAHKVGTGSLLYSLDHAFSTLSYFSVFWGGIVLFFIALPLGIAIDALIYQLIAKVFLGVWKGNYDKTFVALMYGLFPLLLLLWLSVIPLFNSLFVIIAPIWSIIVIVIALSNQQKVTRLNALITMVLKSILLLVFFALLGISIFASLAYLISGIVPIGSVGPLSNVTSGWLTGHSVVGIMP